MPTTLPSRTTTPDQALIHAVNNFLNLVMTTGQVALDAELDYSPERALGAILDGAEGLTKFVRASREELLESRGE